ATNVLPNDRIDLVDAQCGSNRHATVTIDDEAIPRHVDGHQNAVAGSHHLLGEARHSTLGGAAIGIEISALEGVDANGRSGVGAKLVEIGEHAVSPWVGCAS